MSFALTLEQQNIDVGFGRNRRNMMIQALAGTGKSSTIKLLGSRLSPEQRQKSKFIAFGAGIVEELNKELPEGLRAATVHSLGFGMLKRHLQGQSVGDMEVDDSKYRLLCDYWLETNELGPNSDYFNRIDDEAEDETQVTYIDVCDSIKDLIHFAMVTVSEPTPADLQSLAIHYSVDVPDWEIVLRAVPAVIRSGQTGVVVAGFDGLQYGMTKMISYDEMLYLPLVLPGVRYYFFNCLFVDEAQDLCRAARLLVKKMLGQYGRAVFVADENQAIMGFAGSDCDSVQRIIEEFDCDVYPLTCCWRCPTTSVDLARAIVPGLRAAPNAVTGDLLSIPCDKLADLVRPGHLIICRTVAPLVDICWDLIQRGIPSIVRGRDIGEGLKRVLRDLEKIRGFQYAPAAGQTGPDLRDFLLKYQEAKIFNLSKKPGNEMAVQSMVDRCETLRRLYEKLWAQGRRTMEDLTAEIDHLFDDKIANKVVLCTVHRAKGLQATHVYIVRYDLMPHPMATSEWTIRQEYNLKYVAETRAMQALHIVRDQPGGAIYPFLPSAPETAASAHVPAVPPAVALNPVPVLTMVAPLLDVETENGSDFFSAATGGLPPCDDPQKTAQEFLQTMLLCQQAQDEAGADEAGRMASMWYARAARAGTPDCETYVSRLLLLAAKIAADAHAPREALELAREGFAAAVPSRERAHLRELIEQLTEELSGQGTLVLSQSETLAAVRPPALSAPPARAPAPRSFPQVAACVRTCACASAALVEFVVFASPHLYLLEEETAA
jgi:DNA helicase-2/ATP-dependent DNA helicase PcrA